MALSAKLKSGKIDFLSLFSTGPVAQPIFRKVISLKICQRLLLAFRFDDSNSRIERCENDYAVSVSSLFYKFVKNCRRNTHASIDEMFVSFRGRCPFCIHKPNKPAKYGLKILCLIDTHTSYLYNAYLYLGKDSDRLTSSREERNE